MQQSINYGAYPRMMKGHHTTRKFNASGNINNALSSSETLTFTPWDQGGFLEPYGTMLEMTVETANNQYLANDSNFTNKILALDGDAHSLISNIVIRWNGKELERISDADVLNRVLNDVNWGSSDVGTRMGEGASTVTAPGLPNSILTSYMVPSTNAGTAQQVKTWMPAELSLTSYTDSSARLYAFGVTTTGSLPVPNLATNSNYPVQHVLINNKLSFNPLGYNDTAVTYSAGVDITESYNDFSNPAGATSSNISNGLAQYFTPDFCRTCFEPIFSKTVRQRYINNGYVKTDFLTGATFYIKLRSGLIGELMPIERYRLIPLWLLMGLTVEVTFAPYAFYTSWFSTGSAARAYQITSCKLHCTIFTPDRPTEEDPTDIKAIVDHVYATKGINILTQSWTQGPKSIWAQGRVGGTISLNYGFDTLRNIIFFFVPNDYTIASNSRKSQRFSMSVHKVQLRIGNYSYPQDPMTGNGGTNAGPLNNYEFFINMLACFQKHCGSSPCSINPSNFAISCTALDPTQPGLVGINDNHQLSLLENNRVLGKAVYGIPLDKMNFNNSSSGGFNTTRVIPFELTIDHHLARFFPRAVTQYIYFHHDLVIRLQPTGGVGGVVESPELVLIK